MRATVLARGCLRSLVRLRRLRPWNRFQREAARLVRGIENEHRLESAVKDHNVSCTHIRGDTADCVVRDSGESIYRCFAQVGQDTYVDEGCTAKLGRVSRLAHS